MNLKVNGKYVLTKKLGSGAFGEIFLGNDSKTGHEVAVKLVSKLLKIGRKTLNLNTLSCCMKLNSIKYFKVEVSFSLNNLSWNT